MQIKTKMRCHFTLTRIKKCSRECGETGPHTLPGGRVLRGLKAELPSDPAVTPRYLPNRNETTSTWKLVHQIAKRQRITQMYIDR